MKEALEAGLLGHMIIDPTIIPAVRERIDDDYEWTEPEYADLWYAITAIHDQGATVDAMNIKAVLDAGHDYNIDFKADVAWVARVLEAAPDIDAETIVDRLSVLG